MGTITAISNFGNAPITHTDREAQLSQQIVWGVCSEIHSDTVLSMQIITSTKWNEHHERRRRRPNRNVWYFDYYLRSIYSYRQRSPRPSASPFEAMECCRVTCRLSTYVVSRLRLCSMLEYIEWRISDEILYDATQSCVYLAIVN